MQLILPLSAAFINSCRNCNHYTRIYRNERESSPSQPPSPPSPELTTPDPMVDSPSSLLYYDDLLNQAGVVCARGVCVLVEEEDGFDYGFDDKGEPTTPNPNPKSTSRFVSYNEGEPTTPKSTSPLSVKNYKLAKRARYLMPRLTLTFASLLYGTNFPLGAFMNADLPASATTSSRMLLGALVLSPFLPKLEKPLIAGSLLCGCFTALGYISQSVALVDTDSSTVAFLGAVTVIVCPLVDSLSGEKDVSLTNAPQTWLAAALCIVGVGILELGGGNLSATAVGTGDVFAVLQGIGFGVSFSLTERLMRGSPGMALPVTATQVAVTAFLSALWCLSTESPPDLARFGLLSLFTDPEQKGVLAAVLWTGVVTTACNRLLETYSIGKMGAAEASVILATEPIFAAGFALLFFHEGMGANALLGGSLIVAACLVNTLKKEDFRFDERA